MTNKNGLLIEVGKSYYYWNIGLGETRNHKVKGFSNNVWAVANDGRVEIDSLYEHENEVPNILYDTAE